MTAQTVHEIHDLKLKCTTVISEHRQKRKTGLKCKKSPSQDYIEGQWWEGSWSLGRFGTFFPLNPLMAHTLLAVSMFTGLPFQWQSHWIYRDLLLFIILGCNRIKLYHQQLDYLDNFGIFFAWYLKVTHLKHYSRANNDIDYKYKHSFLKCGLLGTKLFSSRTTALG